MSKKQTKDKPWVATDKEICEGCMHGYGTCKECAKGKTELELARNFDERNF